MAEFDVPFTLDQLRIVRAISEYGSFRKAADKLFVSQPAVSLQVQSLERSLEVTLFDRGGRRVILTEAGKLLVDYSSRILNLSEEACRALVDLQDLKRGTLALGASQTVGTYMMPRLIAEFRQSYPQISVQLQVLSTRRIASGVAEGQFDLAIVGGTIPPQLKDQLDVSAYATDEFVLVRAHPDAVAAQFERSPLASSNLDIPTHLRKEELYELRFITLNPQSTTKKAIDSSLETYDINPAKFQVEMELTSLEAIKNAVKAGLGVAFLSLTAVAADLELGLLEQLHVEGLEVKRTLRLIYSPNRYQSQVAQSFRQHLQEASARAEAVHA
ncbi:LysR substrate-binding domain-containing protein [Synechococcus sp. PCC 7336]|uniref:LysR substrate-binding domain-containing protein n=1 Tax=Synechococcus sp. PCC 7336 TaxID=195250 RepID=UPI0003489831|nr:LysR substrate-binding domain-containing protein [Synechococcus sp. PCC 7336]